VAATDQAGALVRARREAHGLSQARLALRAGTTQAAVSRVERGELSPSVATLERLLWAMGEELGLSAQRAAVEWDEDHLRDSLGRDPAERLALALSWNRLAGQLSAAGRRARGDAS
jgi:transcriptional regulator with XRE-family HTH domain